MPKTIQNDLGIKAGDDVIVHYRHSDIRALSGSIVSGEPYLEPHIEKVERVTRTQFHAGGVRYHNDGQQANRHTEGDAVDLPGRSWAFRYATHQKSVPAFIWLQLLAHVSADVQPPHHAEAVNLSGESLVLRGVNVMRSHDRDGRPYGNNQLHEIGHVFPMDLGDRIHWGAVIETGGPHGQYLGPKAGYADKNKALDVLVQQYKRKVEDKQEEADEHEREAEAWERFKRLGDIAARSEEGQVFISHADISRVIAYTKRRGLGFIR